MPRFQLPSASVGLNQGNIDDVAGTGIFMSSMILHMVKDSKFGSLQCDPCLYDYIELFKCKLMAAESKEYVSFKPVTSNLWPVVGQQWKPKPPRNIKYLNILIKEF